MDLLYYDFIQITLQICASFHLFQSTPGTLTYVWCISCLKLTYVGSFQVIKPERVVKSDLLSTTRTASLLLGFHSEHCHCLDLIHNCIAQEK